jgi:hypothetical protein
MNNFHLETSHGHWFQHRRNEFVTSAENRGVDVVCD